MGLAGTPVSPGDHACCVFEADDDQSGLVGSFARDAVARHDRIFYLADRSDESRVTDYLADAGVDGRAMLDSGALQVLHSSQMGLEDGFERSRQLAVWRQLTAAARDDGYRGLAVLAEMSWALTWNLDLDALVDYEATAEPVFVSGELSAVCQYDRRLFDDELLERVSHAHRYATSIGEGECSIDYNRLILYIGKRLELAGEIDLANVGFLETILDEVLAEGDACLDCSGLSFIDARGCRVLHDATKGGDGKGRLSLSDTPEIVARVMRVYQALEETR